MQIKISNVFSKGFHCKDEYNDWLDKITPLVRDEIMRIRKSLMLSQKHMSLLLGFGNHHIMHFENGGKLKASDLVYLIMLIEFNMIEKVIFLNSNRIK